MFAALLVYVLYTTSDREKRLTTQMENNEKRYNTQIEKRDALLERTTLKLDEVAHTLSRIEARIDRTV